MAFLPSSRPPLSGDRIQMLLAQVLSQPTPGEVATLDPASLTDYQRLMSIYAIVQLGGVARQREAIRLHYERQVARLHAETDAQQPALLAQELADLERAIAWQLAQLDAIDPAEEEAVQQTQPAIVAFLHDLMQAAPRRTQSEQMLPGAEN